MITKWKVSNFKSVRKETELDIAPLTIFAGANSSGKSTFLQPILLVAQTLAHKVTSRPVVLNGSLARLGQYDDLRSVNSKVDQISVGWTVQPPSVFQERGRLSGRRSPYNTLGEPMFSSVSCEMSFDTRVTADNREIAQTQPRLHSTRLSVVTQDSGKDDQRLFVDVHRATATEYREKQKWITSMSGGRFQATLEYTVEIDSRSLAGIREDHESAVIAGCFLNHFLPERLSLRVDKTAEEAKIIFNTLVGGNFRRTFSTRYHGDHDIVVPERITDYILDQVKRIDKFEGKRLADHLSQPPRGGSSKTWTSDGTSLVLLTEAMRGIPRRFLRETQITLATNSNFEALVSRVIREERRKDFEISSFPLPRAVQEGTRYLNTFFSTSVRYLGPLRDEPKLLHPLSPTADPSDIGLKGENTAAVLELNKKQKIKFIPSSAFSGADVDTRPQTRTLEEAVVDWLKYLGVAESVDSKDKGKLGHELTVQISESDLSHDLTHVGVGVSQVLPILVTSLLSDPDTTLVFEQPELHLHPKVQTRLADFLLSITQLGKQCILETHSEYLINRIRFRIAAAVKKNPWMDAVKIYFVEREAESSIFREVIMNEYGAILDWPEGFFDQSQQETELILLAAAKKHRAQRKR